MWFKDTYLNHIICNVVKCHKKHNTVSHGFFCHPEKKHHKEKTECFIFLYWLPAKICFCPKKVWLKRMQKRNIWNHPKTGIFTKPNNLYILVIAISRCLMKFQAVYQIIANWLYGKDNITTSSHYILQKNSVLLIQ